MTTFSGWQLAATWTTGSSSHKNIDGIQSIKYELVNNIETKEECGSRYVTYLVEGTYGLTGTIERFYTGSGVWSTFFQGTGSTGNSPLSYGTLKVYPDGNSSGKPFILIDGIKFNKNGISHKLAANLMIESWDFIATGSVATGTV